MTVDQVREAARKLDGQWTPQDILYLARAETINALCDLLNGWPTVEARLTKLERVADAARGVIQTGEDDDGKWVSLLPAGQVALAVALADLDEVDGG